jgi:CheY-like chemotaxis protein
MALEPVEQVACQPAARPMLPFALMDATAAHRVLVVDDDEAMRTVTAEVLRQDGHEVSCAGNGADALAVMRSGAVPELLLLDLMMPMVTGWQLLEEMRDDPQLSHVPVVILTAFGSTEELPAGCAAVHKPVDPAVLLQLLRTTLEPAQEPAVR